MAICTGLIVANIYYCQPLIVLIGKGLGIPAPNAGSVVFFTQSGYALEPVIFCAVRRQSWSGSGQILWMTGFHSVVFLAVAALSPKLVCLGASLLIGATSSHTAVDPADGLTGATGGAGNGLGKVIGSQIMSGLLIGILPSGRLAGLSPARGWAGGACSGWRRASVLSCCC